VPFGQDDYVKKPNSLVADMDSIDKTIMLALEGKQIEPVIY
jgi:dipicolinate synthase subunit B